METTLLRQDKEWEIHKIKLDGNAWYVKLSDGQVFTYINLSELGCSETSAMVELENHIESGTGLKTFTISNKGEGNLIAVKKAIKPVGIKVRK